MKQKYTLVAVSTYSEHMNGATFAVIPPEAFAKAKAYQAELELMKDKGLTPYRINEFYYSACWLEGLPRISRELAEELDVVVDEYCDLEGCLAEAEEYGRPTVDTVEELCNWEDADDPIRSECDTINVQDEGFTFKAHIKHTEVQMETKRLACKYLKAVPLLDNDYYEEQE